MAHIIQRLGAGVSCVVLLLCGSVAFGQVTCENKGEAKGNATSSPPSQGDVRTGLGVLFQKVQETKTQGTALLKAAEQAAKQAGTKADALAKEAGTTSKELAEKAAARVAEAANAIPKPKAPAEPRPDKSKGWSLRPEYERLGLDIRNQGRRGTCTIFATLGVIEFHYARRGERVELSEQFAAWAAKKGKAENFSNVELIEGIKVHGVCREDLMPYSQSAAKEPSKQAKDDALNRRSISVTYFQDYSETLKNHGFTDQCVKAICGSIADGDPVTVALKGFGNPKLDESNTIGKKGSRNSGGGGHMVVLVGFEIDPKQPGGGRCEIRNSWGQDWGEEGYAWITFDYLKKNGQQAYAVRAF